MNDIIPIAQSIEYERKLCLDKFCSILQRKVTWNYY